MVGQSPDWINMIDLRKNLITEDPMLMLNNVSQSTATGQISIDAGMSLQDQRKKMVEKFQMSVMKNDLKLNQLQKRITSFNRNE